MHHDEIQSLLAEWNVPDHFRTVMVTYTHVQQVDWCIDVRAAPPAQLPLVAGDLVQNVRSALDHIAWKVFLAGGGDPRTKAARNVYFPIVDDESKWGTESHKKVPGADPRALAVMRSLQPFARSGSEAGLLTELAALSNFDKHQDLHLCGVPSLIVEGVVPAIARDEDFAIGIFPPGPLVPGRTRISTQVVYEFEKGPFAPVKRRADLQVALPPEPEVNVGLVRGDGGAGVVLDHLRLMIDEAARIHDEIGILEFE